MIAEYVIIMDFPKSNVSIFLAIKMTSTCIKKTIGIYVDGDKNKVYVKIIDNFYVIVYVIRRLDVP